MTKTVEEIRVVHMDSMSPQMMESIVHKVRSMPENFRKNFCGYVKITYVTASPRRIDSIDPIIGTFSDYAKSIKTEGTEIPDF